VGRGTRHLPSRASPGWITWGKPVGWSQTLVKAEGLGFGLSRCPRLRGRDGGWGVAAGGVASGRGQCARASRSLRPSDSAAWGLRRSRGRGRGCERADAGAGRWAGLRFLGWRRRARVRGRALCAAPRHVIARGGSARSPGASRGVGGPRGPRGRGCGPSRPTAWGPGPARASVLGLLFPGVVVQVSRAQVGRGGLLTAPVRGDCDTSWSHTCSILLGHRARSRPF
jgi:hypothetical protein